MNDDARLISAPIVLFRLVDVPDAWKLGKISIEAIRFRLGCWC